MITPQFSEVKNYFATYIKDEWYAETIARQFWGYHEHHSVDGHWTVLKTKNRRFPMKDWKGAVRVWMRNLPKFNKSAHVYLTMNNLYANRKTSCPKADH